MLYKYNDWIGTICKIEFIDNKSSCVFHKVYGDETNTFKFKTLRKSHEICVNKKFLKQIKDQINIKFDNKIVDDTDVKMPEQVKDKIKQTRREKCGAKLRESMKAENCELISEYINCEKPVFYIYEGFEYKINPSELE